MSTEPTAPAPAPAPQPAPEPKKQSIGKRILLYVVGLVVAAVAIYGFNYFTSDAAQTKAGDCATVKGTTSSPDYKSAGCDSADANYVVGKALSSLSESCGSDGYVEYTESARRGPKTKLCLVPRLAEGKCYDFDNTTSMEWPAIDCGKSGAAKVVKVVKDAEPDCGEANAYAFTAPKIAYCVAPGDA
ncbi:hypothetical protein Lesp02_49360 [Lentzea sp. NBRC 105346]|uniref:LppU/SCO3897 family protein n=1 Tax=Lentzea sp. NBRC 105346 TaxID=3032205 RepID=UPI0024A5A820|nr:hypothetical protein [Lentzea sp. NBRC 105346]GLZ32748.1 hypothetical protein Lesp02_49360 [Lentzea sp. NBRC 105346]